MDFWKDLKKKSHRKQEKMDEIIEEEPAVQEDVQDDLVKKSQA